MTSATWKPMQGRMDCSPPTKTAQSSTRIAQNTSIEKFLIANPNLDRIDVIKKWMKHLFVATSEGTEMKKIRAYYAMQLSKILTVEPWKEACPLGGCFELQVIFTFGWLKSTPKAKIEESLYAFKKTSPDTDNMYKALKDAFERAGIVKNDSMIVRDIIEKRHGPVPGITWRLRPLMEYQPKPGLFPGG